MNDIVLRQAEAEYQEHRAVFVKAWGAVARQVHAIAVSKGWWDETLAGRRRNEGEMIALSHAELSEALEGIRDGNPPDKHCPEYGTVDVELADVIIRIMDHAEFFGYDVVGALCAKLEYNRTRLYKHGGKAF